MTVLLVCFDSWEDVSYWPPCRNECLYAKRACGSTIQLDCDQYEENELLCYRAVSVVWTNSLCDV